jgi:uncharacterized protein (TIGR03437 family)
MRIRLSAAMQGLLAMAFPIAALSASGTATLSIGQTLSLDTGITATSGGDIMWTTGGIVPQAKATVDNYVNDGPSAPSIFAALNQSTVSTICSAGCNSLTIPASQIATNDIFFVKTSGGVYGAALVTATNGLTSTVTLQFATYGSSSAPVITEVENNYGDIPAGFSNSGIAQGSLFFVFGSGLAFPGTIAVLQNAVGNTLPTTINGASITVTVGSTTVTPAMYYAQPTAVAGVLPSNTPLGAGTVTVTYNNQASNSYPITVVANAMGFLAYDEGGTGLGVAVNLSGGLYNYANSIPPGTTVILYGSGLGADPKGTGGNAANGNRDTTYVGFTSVAADSINSLTHIYVGGVDGGTPGYQGASGYPGLNQINFTIPATAPTGCNVSLVGVNALGVPTNVITLPIGTGACSDPTFGVSGAQTQNLGGQTSVTSGVVGIYQSTSPGNGVSAFAISNFDSYSGTVYADAAGVVSLGGCVINQSATSTAVKRDFTGLDAGSISVTGPSGTTVTLTAQPSIAGQGFAQLPSGYIPTTGGTFTFNGIGGANVGAFTASVVFPNPVLNWTNQNAAANITRSSGLTVAWTGGSSGTYVSIGGSSQASSTSPLAGFTCLAPVSAGQFTVPAYILAALPAGSGSVTVNNNTNYQTFTASGLNYGAAYGIVGVQVNSTFN